VACEGGCLTGLPRHLRGWGLNAGPRRCRRGEAEFEHVTVLDEQMTGERTLGGCVAARFSAAHSLAETGLATSSGRRRQPRGRGANRRLRRGAEDTLHPFTGNALMFVDYLVTGIPVVGYGDLYKGRAEVVRGARSLPSNDVRVALGLDLAAQFTSTARFAHRLPKNQLLDACAFSTGVCARSRNGEMSMRAEMNPWCMTLGLVLGTSRWRPAPDQPSRGAN
jgi:hypothetical protein